MGAIVNLRGGLLASLAAAALLLAGCGEECVPVRRNAPLPAPYNQFFGRVLPCYTTIPPPVPASSSSGLTDSFIGSCMSAGVNHSDSGCETTVAERRSVYNQASLYGFSFTTELEQTPTGPRLLLRDQSANSGTPTTELTYHFESRQAAGSSRGADYLTVGFAQPPVVTELTNFASGGRTYAQVWRITNPLKAAQGKPAAVTVFYIDRDYGLIRFEQRDGTSWMLAF